MRVMYRFLSEATGLPEERVEEECGEQRAASQSASLGPAFRSVDIDLLVLLVSLGGGAGRVDEGPEERLGHLGSWLRPGVRTKQRWCSDPAPPPTHPPPPPRVNTGADRDNFLSPKQAIELGLIDGVIS
jgi:hypothetical protein